MIYLDSHVVARMYGYGAQKLSERAFKLIEDSAYVLISAMVLPELEFLRETGKIAVSPQTIYGYLCQRAALEVFGPGGAVGASRTLRTQFIFGCGPLDRCRPGPRSYWPFGAWQEGAWQEGA